MSTVRFLREYRRKPVGSTDSGYPYGVHDVLVLRGIAEWVDKSPETTTAIPEPVAEELPRERKSRRFSPKES